MQAKQQLVRFEVRSLSFINFYFNSKGADFSLITTSFNIAMGLGDDETMNVMVMVTEDLLVEGTESYILSVSVSSGPASIGAMDTVTVNIDDNDCKL